MEEILASIRRIIADDQDTARAPEPPKPASAPPPEEEEDVLDLAEIASPKRSPSPPPLDLPEADVSFRDEANEVDFDAVDIGSESEPEPAPAPQPTPAPRPPEPPAPAGLDEDRLISAATDASVGKAFNLLASTVLSNNALTLEDLVREMLRPMLKNWLDDNLPTIVERLVRTEIERVARGR
jgi:cell pole-organizing protein PopZ